MHQDVLADRLDLGDRHRRQRVIVVYARQCRKHRLEADDWLTRERAVQGRRGTMDGVAFRQEIDPLEPVSKTKKLDERPTAISHDGHDGTMNTKIIPRNPS